MNTSFAQRFQKKKKKRDREEKIEEICQRLARSLSVSECIFRANERNGKEEKWGELYIPKRITSIPSYDSRDFSTSRQSVEIFLRLFDAVRKKLVVSRKFQSRTIFSFPLFAFCRFKIIVFFFFFHLLKNYYLL